MIKHFINLSNGLEWVSDLPDTASYIRIQSTWCEQKRWSDIIRDIDANLLMCLALGHECVVYDASSNHKFARAQWQGVEFLRYAVSEAWGIRYSPPPGNSALQRGMTRYFTEEYRKLTSKAKRKLRYFSHFLHTDEVQLRTVCRKTNRDGRYDELAMLALGAAAFAPSEV